MNTRRKLSLLVGLFLLAAPAVMQAQILTYSTNVDGSIYTYDANTDGSINVVAYFGPPWAVAIPTKINGLTVTSIGFLANYEEFAASTNLTSVIIPDTVTSIGFGAFDSFYNLTNVVIPNSVTSVGEAAFAFCARLTNVTLSSSLAGIPDFMFSECTNLSAVTIPDSVITIGNWAFQWDANLTNVIIGSGVTSIGIGPFAECPGLTSITIPNNVTSIGAGAFDSSWRLANVTFGNGVISIGDEAFEDCGLTNIILPASVTSVGTNAFYDCVPLSSVCFQGNAPSDGGTVFENDPRLSTIFYVNGTTGWGAKFSGVNTEPCVQCGVIPVGALQVNIAPAAATNAGAQWQVDAGAFQPGGATVSGLVVGNHTVSFSTISGWLAPSNEPVVVTANATNIISGTYLPLGHITANPKLTITSPKSGQKWSNSLFTVTGTVTDKVPVEDVFYQLNGGNWTPATPGNSWSNWTAGVTLKAGTNTISAYAVDASETFSKTNTVVLDYILSAALTVHTNGNGTVSPNDNNSLLQIGKTYSLTAKPAKGFAFQDWSGSISTNSTKLSFVMQSNLTFTANFADVTRPVNIIAFPAVKKIVTNSPFAATGKASDNVGVISVSYQLNNAGWSPATSLNEFANWTTPNLPALSGPNLIQAFAVDAAGNRSLTNSVQFTYKVAPIADWAPDSLNGLLAWITPSKGSPESVGFDPITFAQTGVDTNAEDYGVGDYLYSKLATNSAELALTNFGPPFATNVTVLSFVFTNHYTGYFTNASSGDTGTFDAIIATNLLPGTVSGRTMTAIDAAMDETNALKFVNGGGFIKTPANNSNTGTSSGTYLFTRFNPVCGVLTLTFTNVADAGTVDYVQTTYTNSAAGTYFISSVTNGVLQYTGTGRFNLK